MWACVLVGLLPIAAATAPERTKLAAPARLTLVDHGRPVVAIVIPLEGTKRLPDWHASAGGASWVFVDELVVR